MRNRFLMFTMLLGLTTTAQAEIWACNYDGQWSTFNSNDRGVFNWKVIWQSNAKDGWNITGDYTDQYGESVLNGTCSGRSCSLTQDYRNGQLQGKRYYWKGDYTDQMDGATSINRFNGTWGTSSQASDGGKWNAVATCLRS